MGKLYRPRGERMIAGVCAGIANRFDVSPVAIRLLTVMCMVFFGVPIWIYVLLWILIPDE